MTVTTPTINPAYKSITVQVIRQFIAWIPIVIGLVHQILMALFGIDRIYVFLNPPQYIYPFVTLEAGWWFMLTVGTAVLCVLAYTNRIKPHRILYPFYLYLLFLLILVKPI